MKKLKLNGPVVSEGDKWYYDWWEKPCITAKQVHDFLDSADGEDVQVRLNSGGGEVFVGSEIYSALKDYPGNVEVVITGLAASIASIIMLAGDVIKASPLAQIMIHNASWGSYGDYRQLKHDSEVVENASISLADMYAKKTGKQEAEIRELLDAETWFTASSAKEIGLIDDVLYDEMPSLVAGIDLVPKDKIEEFKNMVAQQKAHINQAKEDFEARVKAIVEPMINDYKNRPTSDFRVSIEADELTAAMDKLAGETTEKSSSLFAKFIF
ncbi:Clp protease ClpP [Streptococcus equi subsp. zooepidemicus]|uniref:head maturation protease, ClpP-related n=1 Tax=Streptococcus equi TaxID=1336 RepID=UPI001E62A770|nr:head maturation protease, ClpP-related [Streptococcus equi]MCD3433187.1 Clp protease ClpP [Streptococcus equi subsp. zooepidemicus]HEL0067069.1 Clp protease ClpP [Streptococcus equi subsp. zooepidemicus]HEL0075316.1 Clp protease ClpP [Streptococcus equi subsp. zooepidemicus]HEL0089349.1 Clp protease ClpP [Streptococcus equi subsp. zooepidemicus]HEL0447831.1 Clp protease ClpP [Streptococcus equi subsp. zooepidemicus]